MGCGFSIDKATPEQSELVANLVIKLLREIHHEIFSEKSEQDLIAITADLLKNNKVIAFIAKNEQAKAVGIITLHESAAIYAGGSFGELSELFVEREYRSGTVGHGLLNSCVQYGREQGWKRLEVGLPDANQWTRTHEFLKSCGFVESGQKLKLVLK